MSKLRFRTVHFSSEDNGYPASELNVHSPTTKGWQSIRFCEYPQEIGITYLLWFEVILFIHYNVYLI